MEHEDSFTPAGFSYSSVRRRIRQSVSDSLSRTLPLSSMMCDYHNSEIVTTAHSADAIDDNEMQHIDDSEQSAGLSEKSDDFDQQSLSSCESSDDISNNITPDQSLSVFLAEWSLQHSVTLSAIGDLLQGLRVYHPDLPKDPRTLLKTPTVYTLRPISNGHYYHFGILSGINENSLTNLQTIRLQFNVDGLPLFRSSATELWPILCLVKETQSAPFVVGIYCGKKKPSDLNEFLCDFVADLKTLLDHGITVGETYKQVTVDSFICDTPARAYIKRVKLYSGYHGCDKCTQEGKYVAGKVTYPQTDADLRTDEGFLAMTDEEHHHGKTPLSDLNVGLVTAFPIDYMHSVCLGVMRRMLSFWIRGPINVASSRAGRLSAKAVSELSERLTLLSSYVPVEFARKPRSLHELDRWKATEFRQFLLYTGPVVLPDFLSETVFNHFMLFSAGISLLCSPHFCIDYNNYANELLLSFVELASSVYDAGFLVYNVHSLVHLAADVKLHGNLDAYSAFPFENHLRKIKHMVRKAANPLPQIIRRIMEKQFHGSPQLNTDRNSCIGIGEHSNGPVPKGFSLATQYCKLVKSGMCVTIDVRDNCVIPTGLFPVKVVNILLLNGTYHLVCQRFRLAHDLFVKPLTSSSLGILRVSGLHDDLEVFEVTNKLTKCACLPVKNSVHYAVFPLLHQYS